MAVIILQYNASSSVLIATLGIGLFSETSAYKQKLTIGPDTLTVGTLLNSSRYGFFTSTSSNSTIAASIGRGAANTASGFAFADLYTYSADTYTVRAAVTAFCTAAATSIESTGYFFGGSDAGGDGSTKRYVYSTDAYTNNIALAVTTGSNMQGGAAGNTTLALFSLGYSGGDSRATNKIPYATETSSVGSLLSVGGHKTTGIGSATAAYFVGGNASSIKNDKYVYSSDVTSSATALPSGTICASGFSSPFAGYISGGKTGAGSAKVQKLTFATEAWFNSATLSSSTSEAFGGCSNIHIAVLGSILLTVTALGLIGEAGANKKIYQFADDTLKSSSTIINSSRQRSTLVATAGGSTLAFTSGGVGADTVVFNDLYEYSSDTFTEQSNLTSQTSHSNALGVEAAAYIFNGYVAGSNINAIKKFDFARYTFSSLGTTVINASRQGASAGNSIIGIIVDGYAGGYNSSTERFTYSTEAIASGTNLNTAAYGRGAFANPTTVLFVGGANAATSVQKYTIASNVVSTETSLTNGYASSGSFGSYSVGYIVGGGGGNAGKVEKYTWASGTWAVTLSAGIPQDDVCGGVSNVHGGLTGIPVTRILFDNSPDGGYGLICEAGPATGSSAKQKYSFTNDTIAYSTSATATPRTLTGTTSNVQFAFICGGNTGAIVANNDLYSFPNDTFTVATALASGVSHMSGTGTSSTGYIFAGYTGANLSTTRTYAYTTAVQATGTALIKGGRQGTAAGNTTNAILADGYGPTNTTENYTYSNNTRVASGTLGTSDYARGSFASPTAVLITGGSSDGTATQILTIASNVVSSATTIPVGHNNAASFGSRTVGIIAGGSNNSAEKYTWAGGTWAAVATSGISSNSQQGGASTVHSGLMVPVINTSLLYYGVGLFGETFSIKLYNFANSTIFTPNASTISSGANAYFTSTASNSSIAFMYGRGPASGSGEQALTNIYTFSTDTIINGANAASILGQSCAAGTATAGYFFGGSVNNTEIGAIKKVVFSTRAISTPTNLTANGRQGGAAGNTTIGIIHTGYPAKATNRFVYASETIASTTSVAAPTTDFRIGAFSSPTNVMFSCGYGAGQTCYNYTIASATVAATTNTVTVNADCPSSFGNTILGVLAGGDGVTEVRSYTWATGIWAVNSASGGPNGLIAGGASNCHSGL